MVRSFRLHLHFPVSSVNCGQLARDTACCGSYSQTLLSTAFYRLSLCGWVCVNLWGGAQHGAGNAPKQPYTIIATYITESFSFPYEVGSFFGIPSLALTVGSSPARVAFIFTL